MVFGGHICGHLQVNYTTLHENRMMRRCINHELLGNALLQNSPLFIAGQQTRKVAR
jgi:hypothetical protein